MALSGCVGRYESDFPVIVVNRTANTIQALANGNDLGPVNAGQTQSFSITLPESNANVFNNGTAPTPQADVTFTARDTRTGALSTEKNITLSQDTPTYVAFTVERLPEHRADGGALHVLADQPDDQPGRLVQRVLVEREQRHLRVGFRRRADRLGRHDDAPVPARGGTFTITLTVTSDSRQTSTSSRTITVSTTLPPDGSELHVLSGSSRDQSGCGLHRQRHAHPGGPGGPGIPLPGPGEPVRGRLTPGTSATGRRAPARR